jgi:hypothetical protein
LFNWRGGRLHLALLHPHYPSAGALVLNLNLTL